VFVDEIKNINDYNNCFGFKIPLSIIFPNFKGENSIKGST
jgi:hypothetical protein